MMAFGRHERRLGGPKSTKTMHRTKLASDTAPSVSSVLPNLLLPALLILGCRDAPSPVPVLEPLFGAGDEAPVLCAHQARIGVALGPEVQVAVRSPSAGSTSFHASVCQPEGLAVRGKIQVLSADGRLLAESSLNLGPSWSDIQVPLRVESDDRSPVIRFASESDQRLVMTNGRWEGAVLGSSRAAAEAPLRVFLVSVDTLRADVLRHPERLPHLAQLSLDAQVFANAYAAASWTRPSNISLLSGRLPAVHGVIGFDDPIPIGLRTVGQRLQVAGFQTLGVVADIVQLDGSRGFDHGFDAYIEYAGQSERGVAQLGYELGRLDEDRPLFVFFHGFDPHSDSFVLPYEGADWTPAKVEEKYGISNYGCENQFCATNRLMGFEKELTTPIPGEEEVLHELYLAGAEAADRSLGLLLDYLRSRGWYDDALIVVTSDHGESLLDPSPRVTHGNNWEPVLRVPLLIKWPETLERRGTVTANASGIDVAPTILKLAGLPTDDLLGRDLAAPLPPGRPVFSGTLDHVVWKDGWKLNYGQRGDRLFLLSDDPDERINRFESDAETAMELRELSNRRYAAGRLMYENSASGGQQFSLSPEEVQRLRSLGYLDAGPH